MCRNIYFWIVLISTRLDYSHTPLKVRLTAIIFSLLALLFYTNNLLLVPKLLAKKKYGLYFGLYAILVLIVALLYTFTLKWTIHNYPDIHAGMISPVIMQSESGEMTIRALFREMLPYYITLAIAGALFAMSWFVMNYQRLQGRMEVAQKKHLEAELSFLKSQINPHFLFNTLNNLYALTVKKADEAPEIVAQLSAILRYFLYESDTLLVSSEKEKEMMQAYIDLELLRINGKNNMNFHIETDKPYTIPPLLWVPVLENVFKHGTRFISESYDIEYSFSIAENVLSIHSRNTFKPGQEREATTEGIGLSNLQKRLELLYPGRYKLDISRQGQYFVTMLQIQLA